MQTIQCIYCKRSFEISEALADQISEEEKKHREEEIQKVRLEEQTKTKRLLEEELKRKEQNFQAQLKEDKEQKDRLMQDLLKANEDMRSLRKKDEERELENQKKLSEMELKIKEEATKKATDEKQMEILQMKKQLEDTQKALEEAKRKSTQGSQQLQGEVLELELEEILRHNFPYDEIEAIGKGVNGADIRHIVKSPRGNVCGVILWESKRTKHWEEKWIGKLKEDLRAEAANIPVIVSQELPKDTKSTMVLREGVWVCNFALVLPLAELLRKNLYDIAYQKALHSNSTEKAEMLYTYLTSHEFQQQVEVMVETYRDMQDQLHKERTAYEKIWKMREAQIQKVLLSTASIVGSIQGKVGTSMPEIKGLDLFELSEGN